ncbi:cytoplasmic polyadenylation element-binding protein 1-like [Cyprinus carpio]|uniref:Cytoplasmic polyadenylation element-binding protein 1-like n=1 Tax=Cyprinus carpio TaxID=7962 RepID=A0A9Q9YPW8_CYPCA|nr:cytoplasmic polyadenylation element-binding protein 1-like [Cyprinus carpio]
MSSMQRDPLKLALGSRMDHSSSPLTPPPSATPSGGLSHRWPGASIWPNWDLMKTPESPFSIEREAWLHRQAASINEATLYMEWKSCPQTLPKSHLLLQGLFRGSSLGHH